MNSPKVILGIIWVSILLVVVSFRVFLGEKNPKEERFDAGIVMVSSFLLFGSLIIRTLILPKRDHNPLPLFVAGIVLAENLYLLGFF